MEENEARGRAEPDVADGEITDPPGKLSGDTASEDAKYGGASGHFFSRESRSRKCSCTMAEIFVLCFFAYSAASFFNFAERQEISDV